MQTMNFIT